MNWLFEFIFANFFLVFIIITGLMSLMSRTASNRKKEGQHERQSDMAERPTVRDAMRRVQEMIETIEQPDQSSKRQTVQNVESSKENVDTSIEPHTYSFEEERQQQYEQLKKQYETAAETVEAQEQLLNNELPIFESDNNNMRGDHSAHISKMNVDLQSRLNKEGLIESIVMAEILGPPRARKRYSSRYLER